MRKLRVILGLLSLLVSLLIGVEMAGKTAVAQETESEIYVPLVVADGIIPIGPVYEGIVTYYNATGAGNCGFPATPDDLMVTALNEVQYENAKWCGAFLRVTGPADTIIVRVVDRCPECGFGHLDLSREAYQAIGADGSNIQWQVVSPPIPGPISYFFHRDSHQWWISVQIRNHRNPVAKLEYKNENGQYVEAPRRMWNRFDMSGLGPGPFTFRVTDIFGNVIEDSNIPLTPGAATEASEQFPPAPSG